MVWINTQCYEAKSYPPGAYGGAMCVCPKHVKMREDEARLAGRLVGRRLEDFDESNDALVYEPYEDDRL